MKAQLSFFHDNGKFEATHEIEIPDGATLFQYQTNEGHLYHFYREEGIRSYGHFPIPHPKKKVKKTVEVSLYKDASARWKIPASIDTDKLPNYLGTFTVEIEVEE